jgi:hypothetical protein
MPTVQVSYKGHVKEEKKIENNCWLIWENSRGLTSIVDQEQGEKGGVYMSRIHNASTNPEIVAIFPDWDFFIDGTLQPKGFYESVEGLQGKIVELSYRDYTCIFDFRLQ